MSSTTTAKTITVYGAAWCAFCHMVKRYLDEKNISYTYIDVDQDPQAVAHIIQKTGQSGIPVTQIGDQMIIGFDRPKIDQALQDNDIAKK